MLLEIILLLCGLLAGALSGMSGVGGGILAVPIFHYIFERIGMGPESIKYAVGTSFAVVVPLAIVALIRHWTYDNVLLDKAVFMIVGAVGGALIGVYLAEYVDARYLIFFLGILIIVLGARMVFKSHLLF